MPIPVEVGTDIGTAPAAHTADKARLDIRQPGVRRFKDLIDEHEAHLADISEPERRLVRAAAGLSLQLEFLESRWADNNGEASAKNLDLYRHTVGALRRVLETLGLDRRE